MRAERLGSYSMLFTTAGTLVFGSLKVNDAVFALVATTKVAGGEMAFGVTAAGGFLPTVRDFSGVVAVMVPLNTPITLCLCPGVVGLNFLTAILFRYCYRSQLFCPSARVTSAFFQAVVLPRSRPLLVQRDLFLLRTLMVFTRTTFTP